jgi:ubiquitin C-terminal hydrolase
LPPTLVASVPAPIPTLPPAASRVGLVNLGATCFLAATLQALASLGDLCATLESTPTDDTTAPVTRGLTQVLSALRRGQDANPVLRAWYTQHLCRLAPQLFGAGQQDAHETLLWLLARVREERCFDPSAWFAGTVASRLTCTVCGNTSTVCEETWALSLALPSNKDGNTLDLVVDCMGSWLASEVIDDFRCNTAACGGRATTHTKQLSVQRLPRIVLVQLQRFDAHAGKRNDAVHAPLRWSLGGVELHLVACIDHHGHAPSSGHYTAQQPDPHGTGAHVFDDTHVSFATGCVASRDPRTSYVLLYKKQG